MKKRTSKPLIPIIAFVCFMLGILSVWLKSPATHSQDVPSAPNSTNRQTTLLILGVDDISRNNDAKLLAIWYGAFQLPEKDIFLLGLPISSENNRDAENSPDNLFTFNERTGVSIEFLNLLQSRTALTPDAIIVLDSYAFSQVVDYMGGVKYNDGHLDGIQVIAMIDFLKNDPNALLSIQQQLLMALSQQADTVGDTPDLTALTSLIPENAYISTELSVLLTRTIPLLPISPESIFIDVLQSTSP